MSGGQVTGDDLSNDSHWDSNAKAVANDLMALPRTNTANIQDSSNAMSGLDLDMIVASAGRSATFGTSASPINVCADEVFVESMGGFYMDCAGGALVCDFILIQMMNRASEFVLGSTGGALGDWKDMDINRGKGSIAGTALFDASAAIRIGKVSSDDDVDLTIATAATAVPRVDQGSGMLTSDRTLTLLNMSGRSRCVQGTKPITQAFIGAGCTLVYNHKVLSGETTRIVVMSGGVLDLLGNTEPKTLDNVLVKKGGKLRRLLHSKLHVITVLRDENDR